MHSGYEECRADSVAIYLFNYEEPFDIFFAGKSKQERDDIYYAGWLDMIMSAIKGLHFFDAEQKQWQQAHVNASWVILAVVREHAPGVVKFEFSEKDGSPYFTVHVDRSKLRTEAHKAMSDFLSKLHTLKSLGDFEAAKVFFEHYSEVDAEMLKIRDIVKARRLPRRLELQPNLFKKDGKVEYKEYDSSFEGIIQSYCERFEGEFQKDVYDEWVKDAEKYRYV